jgi:dihydrofolate reductase
MGKTVAAFTMSLDGFIAGPNDEVDRLFKWYSSGDTEFSVEGTGIVFKVSQASAAYLQKEWSKIGAIVTGRRDFDVSKLNWPICCWARASACLITWQTIPLTWKKSR